MIKNANDIYKLIKSPLYTVYPCSSYHFYEVHSTRTPSDWMRIEFYDTHMDIYKYKNRGSEYYETISTTNKRGNTIAKRFKKTLFAKRAVARMKAVSEKQR